MPVLNGKDENLEAAAFSQSKITGTRIAGFSVRTWRYVSLGDKNGTDLR